MVLGRRATSSGRLLLAKANAHEGHCRAAKRQPQRRAADCARAYIENVVMPRIDKELAATGATDEEVAAQFEWIR